MTTDPGQRPVVIAGGGTGGHVYPGLALAREMSRREPDRPLVWIGARGGAEERLVPRAGIPLVSLPLAGVARRGLWRGAHAAWLAALATVGLLIRFVRCRPAVAVGVGGFASGPAVLAAVLLGVPTVLLEQNAVPGRTNRALAPVAAAIAVSFHETAALLGGNPVLTGNPVREEIAAIPPRGAGPLRSVLSFGGSRGARALNEAWIGAMPRLAGRGLRLVIQTGAADAQKVRDAAGASGVEADVFEFLDDMPARLAAADVVVARAGATTVAELTAAGRGAVLVPYPYAADDHQRANARALASAGAALVIDPQDFGPAPLADALARLAGEPGALTRMGEAARRLGRPHAARLVADLVERFAEAGR